MSYFSIIIPVYNRAGIMDICVNSILRQTFEDYEVVFVDDGSVDASPSVIRDYCSKDKRFRYVAHEKNESVLVARYTGMRNSDGEYVLFADSDDYLSENALELIYDSLQKEPVDILRFGNEEVYHDCTTAGKLIHEKNRCIPPLRTDDPLGAVLNDLMSPNVVKNCYSRKVVEKVLSRAELFYCNMGEDVYWSTVFFSCAESDGVLDECLYHYNIGGGMSTSANGHTLEQLAGYQKHLRDCIEHVRSYLSRYDAERVALTERKFLRMNCFLMLTFIIDEPDPCKTVDYLKAFDTEALRSVYRHGCRKILPFKFQRQYRVTDETLDALNIPHGRFQVNYLEDLIKNDFES